MKTILALLMTLSFGVAHAEKASESLGGDNDANWLCDYSDMTQNDDGEMLVACTPVLTGVEAVGNAIYIPVDALKTGVEMAEECGQDAPVVGHVVCGAVGVAGGALRGALKTIFGIFE